MRKYFIHLQAIYPPLIMAIMTYLLSLLFVRNIPPEKSGLISFIIWFGGIWVVLFILDILHRFIRYQSAYRYLQRIDSDWKKLLEAEKIAWCTRESVKAACRQHSFLLYKKSIQYYMDLGIYYYHIFPQNFLKSNSPIFKISYWRSAFFDFRKKDYYKDLH